MSDILASIAIITYNQEKFIRQTMDSVVNQQCNFRFEIVVGEDASPDSTRAIVAEYVEKYPDLVRLMPAAPNKGLLVNFGDTLASCKGKYLSICAGDDYWHNPLKLQKQVDFLEANPEYGVVHTDLNVYLQQTGKTEENYNANNQHGIVDGNVFEAILTSRFFIIPITACFRRSLFEQYVDFAEFKRAGFTYEDLPTWLELSRRTLFKHLPESMATYRVNDNSLSNPTDMKKKFAFLQQHYNIKKYFIDKYNVDPAIAREFEIVYHQRRLNLAYTWNNQEEAKPSYNYLKSQNKVDLKLRLKYTLLGLPVLNRSFKKMKKLSAQGFFLSNLKKVKA